MILVHFRDGRTAKLNPVNENELRFLDSPEAQKSVRRVAIIDGNGHRSDLPSLKNGTSRIWVELIKNGEEARGERVCIRRGSHVLRVTMYYSDGRVVVDL